MTQEVLSDIEYVFIYFDDILIFAKNIEEHDKILKEVINHLGNKKIQISLEKLHFYKEKITLLGYNISALGIEP